MVKAKLIEALVPCQEPFHQSLIHLVQAKELVFTCNVKREKFGLSSVLELSFEFAGSVTLILFFLYRIPLLSLCLLEVEILQALSTF